MNSSADSPAQEGLRRRAMLIGTAGGAAAALGLAGAGTAAAAPAGSTTSTASPEAAADIDWDNGNIVEMVIVPEAEPIILTYVAGNDATIIVRVTTLLQHAWFDAIAPYHATAVGVTSKLGRRPASEGVTNRNKNIAIMYASLRLLSGMIPAATAQWRALLAKYGLDPDNTTKDLRTPAGIGNVAGQAVVDSRLRDGMNQTGDVGRKYHPMPYHDYTGYVPRNTAYELRDPSRWQPNIVPTDKQGQWRVQEFINPQLMYCRPYTFKDVTKYKLPKPYKSDVHNWRDYKAQADEILSMQAGLTDEQKMTAETFDDKFMALGISVGMAGAEKNLPFDDWFHFHMITAVAVFDALIAAWYNKNVWDAVRPVNAIRHIYGDNKVKGWGGPGLGTVSMKATEWQSYLDIPDHTEYPSGSTTLYHAHSQSATRFLGGDAIDLHFPFPKGSSRIEPGVTPAQDIELHFTSWKDFADVAGMSRAYGGVHFTAAVHAGEQLGPQFGDLAYEFVMKYVKGQV
ncbi:DUF6851 domain-containing protein [Actinacidiphila epipremni]|uniref:Vanadium-dependent haloperoxidase n=1 Tax=Actinacidiphila epipremni TaxID=2053013 RepID=A0ABX0ZUJ8_9ACTN|nr:hypothetical protein [Actinacidiphila epipremni]NJP45301.1 hypothetical protein [Actinacidiphila epipremni]